MSEIATLPSVAPVVLPNGSPPLRRFTVEQYHALAKAGVLTEHDRVELLDGLIVEMTPIGPPHAYSVEHTVHDVLGPILPKRWHVRMQQPITLATSEPQPDLAVVLGTRKRYLKRHPGADDIGLLIEVADATVADDRRKAVIYAAAGIPQYWIINLVGRKLEVYRNPRTSRKNGTVTYRYKRILDEKSHVTLTLDGKQIGRIAVKELLP